MDENNVTDRTTRTNGCDMNIFNQCFKLLPNISNRNCIYPLEVSAPDDSEFIKLQSKIQIRTIHVKPDNYIKDNINKRSYELRNQFRRSLSEEYWFTRCNKPIRNTSCNCSFRRSQRVSNINDVIDEQPNISNLRVNVKIINIETYVERLMEETFLQAFQECFILNSKTRNNYIFDNYAYLNDDGDGNIDDDEDDGDDYMVDVNLRNKSEECLNVNDDIKNKKYSFAKDKCCIHKNGTEKTKPLILLFHGIGSSADVWKQLINSLVNKGHEVVAPDMLGHGYSSTPNESKFYSFKNLLNNAISIFDHYVTEHQSQSCIIIAHSFGCSIATALYKFRSQQILQLILISGGGPTPLAASLRDHELSPFNCAEFFLKPFIICGLKRRFFYSSRGKHFLPCNTENAIPSFVTQAIGLGQNWPEGDAAYHRRILIPTLLVYGLQDTKVTLVQECEMERTIPRAFLELIPDAGHMVMLDTPEQLAHMIICFVEWWTK